MELEKLVEGHMAPRTDYVVLSIVGVVAISAIFMMYQIAQTPSAGEPLKLELSNSLTGQVAAIRPEVNKIGYDGEWDFDSDGEFTRQDSLILAEAIAHNVCPFRKDCDLNNDGVKDLTDLGIFNNYLQTVDRSPGVQQLPDRKLDYTSSTGERRRAGTLLA